VSAVSCEEGVCVCVCVDKSAWKFIQEPITRVMGSWFIAGLKILINAHPRIYNVQCSSLHVHGGIDGFHSIFSIGNCKAIHHHAPC